MTDELRLRTYPLASAAGPLGSALAIASFALPAFPTSGFETALLSLYAGSLALGIALMYGAGVDAAHALQSADNRALLLFAILSAFGLVSSQLIGTPASDWVRGVAPFLPLALLPLLRTAVDHKAPTMGLHGIVLTGLLFSGYAAYLASTSLERVAVLDTRFLLPVPAAAATVCLARMHYAATLPGVAAAAAGFIVAAAGTVIPLTRGLVLSLVASSAFVIVASFRTPSLRVRSRAKYSSALVVLSSAIVVGGILTSPLRPLLEARLKDTGTISERADEYRRGFEKGLQAPVTGNGFGVKFDTYGSLAYRGESVGYLHNSLLYFFLTTGVVGVIIYVALFLRGPISLVFGRTPDSWVAVSAGGILILLFVYGLTSAAYRLFQFNAMAAIALSAISNKPKHASEG